MHPTEVSPPVPRRRIAGIDMARALAIIGMLMVHFGPTHLSEGAGRFYALAHGRASVLFVFLAGIGVSLLATSRTTTPAQARWALVWRALVLLPAGLLLQLLNHNVLVILQTFAALFLLGAVVLALRRRSLLLLSALVYILGPLGFFAGETLAPDVFDRAALSITDSLGEIVHGLVLSGPYPLITWAAPFLLGMAVGRCDLRAAAVRVYLLVVGAAVSLFMPIAADRLVATIDVSRWEGLFSSVPHSQMPLWLWGSSGSAVLIFGLALIAADLLGALAWPLVATGQLALSIYVAHLVALHGWREAITSDTVPGAVRMVGLFVLGAAVCSAIWRAIFPRGPLEALLRAPGWLMAREAP